MGSTAWLADHRGPLTVTDSFAVLDDPVEQQAFTETLDAGQGGCASVLVVQGMQYIEAAHAVGAGHARIIFRHILANALSPLIESHLSRVEPGDPAVYLATAIVLVVIGLLAAWIPSRRAARVDPIIALRG